MLTVACVCVLGGFYNSGHVIRLEAMASQHLSGPYNFVVIVESDKPGFWAKIDLFQPGRFEGRVLYLDLDVTVVGGLDDIVNFPAPFAAIRDYGRLGFNSSVMAWDAGVADHVYTDWTPDVMDRLNGDQNWITEQMTGHAWSYLPAEWCPSYKAHTLMGLETDDARVRVYHGLPKPWGVAA